MSAKRSKTPGGPGGSKKPCLQQAFCCPHPACNKSSKSLQGLRIHLGKSTDCALFIVRLDSKRNTKNVGMPPEANHEDTMSVYPWDEDDDNVMDELEDVNDNNHTGLPNHAADGIYSESAHEAAMRFGIRFTTEQFHTTKLLKIISDANAPHYLYKDIVEWGQAAQRDKYDFHPQRAGRNAQVKYLENWLKLQNCRPSTANPHYTSRARCTGRANHLLQFH